jgi:hypothetical protein
VHHRILKCTLHLPCCIRKCCIQSDFDGKGCYIQILTTYGRVCVLVRENSRAVRKESEELGGGGG